MVSLLSGLPRLVQPHAIFLIWVDPPDLRAVHRPPSRLRPHGAGRDAKALLYSLIESAKLCGVEPRAYLRETTLRAVRNPGTVTLARDLTPEA